MQLHNSTEGIRESIEPRSIRIALLINNMASTGGAERLVLNLGKHMDRSQFSLAVVSLKSIGDWGRSLQTDGIPVYALRLDSLNPVYSPLILMRLLSVLRVIDPDVIHTSLWASSFYGRLANLFLRRRLVVSEQNVYIHRPTWQTEINKRLAHGTDLFIAISEAVRDYVVMTEDVPPSNVKVIHSGVDLVEFSSDSRKRVKTRAKLGYSDDEKVLINVASLREQKGHKYLLPAFAAICQRENARLMLVGRGPLQGELENHARALEVRHRIDFLGNRKDISILLNAADIFVFPSIWEGLGLALLEAMAVSLPVVASDLNPIREVVDHERSGLLVRAGSSEALADAVGRYMKNEGFACRLAQTGQQRIRNEFSIEKCVSAHASMYRVVANK